MVMEEWVALEPGEPGELIERGGAFAKLWGKAGQENANRSAA